MKLAMHPIVWVFTILFPFMILIPSYPIIVGFIYVCAAYTILFLGANKGQQTNDVYFSCLLPVKKKNVVKARILTVLFLQAMALVITCALSPLASIVREAIAQSELEKELLVNGNATLEMIQEKLAVGLGPKATVSTSGIVLLAFVVYDFIYFTLFYRNGRSVVLPTLLGMIVFMIVGMIPTLALPLAIPEFRVFMEEMPIIQQLGILLGAIAISLLAHVGIYKIAAAEFEKVDL